MTREQWLQVFIDAARPIFANAGTEIPERVHVSIGIPLGCRKPKTIMGQCFDQRASDDDSPHIYISPEVSDVSRLCDILTHELVHAAVGCAAGHGPIFRRLAVALGLEGPMTSTRAGDLWHVWADPIIAQLPEFPHSELHFAGRPATKKPGEEPKAGNPDDEDDSKTSTRKKKQGTRMLKAECEECGFVFRTTKKWVPLEGPGLRCPDKGCSGDVFIIGL